MPSIDIYKNDEKLGTHTFKYSFYVLEDGEGLFWRDDDDEREGIDTKIMRPGAVALWIRGFGLAHISTILPEWQLIIDGVKIKRGYYQKVYIGGKTIELQKENYRFIGFFPPFDGDLEILEKGFTVFD